MVNMIEIISKLQNYFSEPYSKWIIAIVILLVGFFIIKLVKKYLAHFFDKVDYDTTLGVFMQKIVAFFLWIILFLIILSSLGFNVAGFIAGLGIIGFIIGFATKDVLSNFAAGILLLTNKPFKINESVEVVGIKGIVKEISMSACVIITEDKKYVTVPNSKIWGNPIKNLSRLGKKKDN